MILQVVASISGFNVYRITSVFVVIIVVVVGECTDQQKEATADLRLAVDFIRDEYADQLAANYNELNSVPMMLALLQRDTPPPHVDSRAQPVALSSPGPVGATPAVSPTVETTAPRRHWRRRRLRSVGGIQPPRDGVVTSGVSLAAAAGGGGGDDDAFVDFSSLETNYDSAIRATPVELATYYDDFELTTTEVRLYCEAHLKMLIKRLYANLL